MLNFTYYNPVRVHFGKDQIKKIADEIPKNARVLITYGGGIIKKIGVFDQVIAALKGYTVFEFGNIEPNPKFEVLMQAVELIKKEKIDFLLAVGGGSVIDGTKFIAAAAYFEGNHWDILSKQAPIDKVLPFGCIVTLPAAGSEMNEWAVISNASTQEKLSFGSQKLFAKFAILDPTTTFSLPKNQTVNGIIDTFVHVTEQYLTYSVKAPLQDRFAEGILLTLMEEGPKVFNNPKDYEARANLMWSSTLALNNLIGSGVPQDWSTHMIGHEVTAKFGLDHAVTLAIILPSVLTHHKKQKREKLLQYAERIWNITSGSEEEKIEQAINKTRAYFESMGVKTRLSDYGISQDVIPELVKNLGNHGFATMGERGDIDLKASEEILRMSM